MGHSLRALVATLFALAGAPIEAAATVDVARVFEDKKMSIVVDFGPGGSASLYPTALSQHMGRFGPGRPTTIAQHMPGAGRLAVATYIATSTPADGASFTITGRTASIEPLMGNSNAKFDGRKFNWIGSTNIENTTCLAWHTSGVKTLADGMQRELIIGGTGTDATEVIFPKAINEVLGTKFKPVMIYPGSNEMDLAMERDELQGNCGLGWTVIKNRRKDWLKENKISILFQMALEKHVELPDVPLVLEYAKTNVDRSLFEFLIVPQKMGRPFFAPPNVPQERVAALRCAFSKTLKDKAFPLEAEKSGLEIQFVEGAEVQEIVGHMYDTPSVVLDRVNRIAGP